MPDSNETTYPRCRRLGELEPESAFVDESQIVLPSALFQRLEVFEETSGFFRPSDEPSEAFVINGPFVDFAIRSTWAYASREVVVGLDKRAVSIRWR